MAKYEFNFIFYREKTRPSFVFRHIMYTLYIGAHTRGQRFYGKKKNYFLLLSLYRKRANRPYFGDKMIDFFDRKKRKMQFAFSEKY